MHECYINIQMCNTFNLKNISLNNFSVAGTQIPRVYDIAMYSASKHAVSVLSQSISNELLRENSKIRVTVSIRHSKASVEY